MDRRDWCKDGAAGFESIDCERQTVSSQWQKFATDMPENYPMSYDNNVSEVSCSAFRFLSTLSSYMDIKLGIGYTVNTGYMLYNDEMAYNTGDPYANEAGSTVEMMFEAAAALAAGAALLTTTLFA